MQHVYSIFAFHSVLCWITCRCNQFLIFVPDNQEKKKRTNKQLLFTVIIQLIFTQTYNLLPSELHIYKFSLPVYFPVCMDRYTLGHESEGGSPLQWKEMCTQTRKAGSREKAGGDFELSSPLAMT